MRRSRESKGEHFADLVLSRTEVHSCIRERRTLRSLLIAGLILRIVFVTVVKVAGKAADERMPGHVERILVEIYFR